MADGIEESAESGGPPSRSPDLRVAVYALAGVGAMLIAVGIGMRFGVPWGLVVMGLALVLGAVALVDIPRARAVGGEVPPPVAADASPVGPAGASRRAYRPGPRPVSLGPAAGDTGTDGPAGG